MVRQARKPIPKTVQSLNCYRSMSFENDSLMMISRWDGGQDNSTELTTESSFFPDEEEEEEDPWGSSDFEDSEDTEATTEDPFGEDDGETWSWRK